MATPFLGEIKIMSFNFPPKGWALCNGQLLPINQNQALFSLLGTMYGGNGQTTFALPNLQGRVPLHRSAVYVQGQIGGETSHTLALPEMPQHTHALAASIAMPDSASPTNKYFAAIGTNAYSGAPNALMTPATAGSAGGSQPHENMAPYLVLNFCIALQGIFPSRN